MQDVGDSLYGIAKSIKWLDLPDLPEKGDVSDFIETYGEDAAEKLAILIADAGRFKTRKRKD